MSIKATIIFGETACRHYDESGEASSKKWIKKNDGVVDTIEFKTKAEYDAYSKGLADHDGWNDARILTPTYTKTPDCKFCEQWRSYFSDKDGPLYCPGCGKMILDAVPSVFIEFNGQTYPSRFITFPDDSIGYVQIATEALNDLLMKDGSYVSTEAERVDNGIFCYVPNNHIRMPEEELIVFIQEKKL